MEISEILTKGSGYLLRLMDIHIWFVALTQQKMLRGQDGKGASAKGVMIYLDLPHGFARQMFGMSVHRPDPVNSVSSEIHIWKCRFSWVGKQGFTELDFNTITS